MKAKLILMLGSFWIGYVSLVCSIECMKANMEMEKDSILTEKFTNEVGVINYSEYVIENTIYLYFDHAYIRPIVPSTL